jgi:hypothetical protein
MPVKFLLQFFPFLSIACPQILKNILSQTRALTPVILAIQEAESQKISV